MVSCALPLLSAPVDRPFCPLDQRQDLWSAPTFLRKQIPPRRAPFSSLSYPLLWLSTRCIFVSARVSPLFVYSYSKNTFFSDPWGFFWLVAAVAAASLTRWFVFTVVPTSHQHLCSGPRLHSCTVFILLLSQSFMVELSLAATSPELQPFLGLDLPTFTGHAVFILCWLPLLSQALFLFFLSSGLLSLSSL